MPVVLGQHLLYGLGGAAHPVPGNLWISGGWGWFNQTTDSECWWRSSAVDPDCRLVVQGISAKIGQLRPFEVGTAEVRPFEVRSREVRPFEVRPV